MKKRATPKALIRADRIQKALDLRRQGCSYRAIGAELHITHETAWQWVHIGLEEIREKTAESAEDVRAQSLARLDAALKGLEPGVQAGDPKAIDTLIRVETRRAALLGLDMPRKQELSGPGGGPIAMEDARAVLFEKLAKLVPEADLGTEDSDSVRDPE